MSIQVFGQIVQSVPNKRQQAGSGALQLPLSEMAVSEILPRLYALGWSGLIYSAANQAAQAVSVALATAYTGLGIYNPIGSGVIAVPLKVKYASSIAQAAPATLGLIASVQTVAPTGQTALVVQSSQIGNAATGIVKAVSAATIVTPTWVEHLQDSVAAAGFPVTAPFYMDGHLSVLPGGFLAVGALTAVTGLGSIFWAELPL